MEPPSKHAHAHLPTGVVVAALAIVAALAGTALGGPDAGISVSKRQTKKIARKQIEKLAPGLSVASAADATDAANAAALGGRSPGSFASSASEPWRIVGTPGQPQFENNWADYAGIPTVRFYKDPLGIVHLGGAMIANNAGTVPKAFTLPPGYRPLEGFGWSVPVLKIGPGTETERIDVGDGGGVNGVCSPQAGCAVLLDGVSFRSR